MLKNLPLTFVQQAIEQTLLEQHIKNNHYFGGQDQIVLHSFYEQLKTQAEVDRFVETVRDLNDQQNRTNLIGNGVLLSPENPTITNLYSSLIIPFTWTCSIRTTLGNRDTMIETLQNVIDKLKGKKCDIAQLECEDFEGKKITKLFKVGTLGQNEGQPAIKCGDYIGEVGYNQVLDTRINALLTSLTSKGFTNNLQNGDYLYYTSVGAYSTTKYICVAQKQDGTWTQIEDDGTYNDVVFPIEQTGAIYDKFKLSMSFDSFRVDDPHNLNGEEYCEISFGGSATLCDERVMLGNDLVKLGVQKNKIEAQTPISFTGATIYYLEPLEMPSGLNANTQITQLISNNFKQNTHTDGTAGVLQYTFIMDKSFDILNQWFNYSRFGAYGITGNDICPNLIYNVSEFWSSWGVVDKHTMLGKITESIDIENTESDVLTLGVNFQIQGENN